ncbi:MAG: hypothetical protein IT440_02230 [Phycisphaeraceae bacterium]|nr:hypothetical protein [Phycisphaeraceae bacterium]
MANTITWSAMSTLSTGLSTQLNAMSNDAFSAAGTEIDNATARNRYADLELNVAFGTSPSAGGRCDVYLLSCLDGTNYQDGGSSVTPPSTAWVGSFPLRATTSTQRVHLRGVLLPPAKFKFVLHNKSGQSFPASGSTLLHAVYNEEIQ